MKVEWLTEARAEYRQFLQYYKTEVGLPYAKKFADTILGSINQLAEFPEMGAVKYDTLMGKHDFRALFIENYVCVYRIESDTVYLSLGRCQKELYLPYLRYGVIYSPQY